MIDRIDRIQKSFINTTKAMIVVSFVHMYATISLFVNPKANMVMLLLEGLAAILITVLIDYSLYSITEYVVYLRNIKRKIEWPVWLLFSFSILLSAALNMVFMIQYHPTVDIPEFIGYSVAILLALFIPVGLSIYPYIVASLENDREIVVAGLQSTLQPTLQPTLPYKVAYASTVDPTVEESRVESRVDASRVESTGEDRVDPTVDSTVDITPTLLLEESRVDSRVESTVESRVESTGDDIESRVIEMLQNGSSYKDITSTLGVSNSKVAAIKKKMVK